jgi:aminoglycoside phosphotransferase (APT) family kinase protein
MTGGAGSQGLDGSMSPPYGFCDDSATRRLLRARPPAAALKWAAAQVGATRITSVRALRGGLSSAMHVMTAVTPAGDCCRIVLRRYVRPELFAEEPDIAAREAVALRFVEPVGVPTPRLLGCDATGALAGVPSLVMSRLAGRVEWSPADFDDWLDQLVGLLPAIHSAPLPPAGTIRSYSAYPQRIYEPPEWARLPRNWERAVEIFVGPVLDRGPPVFLHRDFHPGNVLWSRGRATGVVDWQSASVGPASVDVGHCRANLLRYGLDVADRFTRLWEDVSGCAYHPWADIATIVGCLDDLRDPPPANRDSIEEVVSNAVAELGWVRS